MLSNGVGGTYANLFELRLLVLLLGDGRGITARPHMGRPAVAASRDAGSSYGNGVFCSRPYLDDAKSSMRARVSSSRAARDLATSRHATWRLLVCRYHTATSPSAAR